MMRDDDNGESEIRTRWVSTPPSPCIALHTCPTFFDKLHFLDLDDTDIDDDNGW